MLLTLLQSLPQSTNTTSTLPFCHARCVALKSAAQLS